MSGRPTRSQAGLLAHHPPNPIPIARRWRFQKLFASREENAAQRVGLGTGVEGFPGLVELTLAIELVALEEEFLFRRRFVGSVAENFVDADGAGFAFDSDVVDFADVE